MTRRSLYSLGLLAVICVPGLLTGCRANPLVEKRAAVRKERLATTVRIWAEDDQPRPERLRQGMEFIRASERRHAQRLDRTLHGVGIWYDRDAERWRNADENYWQPAGRILMSHPERIERDAIQLFY